MTGNQQQEKNCKKHKHVETKQHATKQPMDHWRNQRRNFKIPRSKWQHRPTIQNLWDAAKAVLIGKFIAIQAYLRTQHKAQINNLTLYLKQLEREQIRPKVSRRKEIIKIRAEINEIETKKPIEKINETKTFNETKLKRSMKLTFLWRDPQNW